MLIPRIGRSSEGPRPRTGTRTSTGSRPRELRHAPARFSCRGPREARVSTGRAARGPKAAIRRGSMGEDNKNSGPEEAIKGVVEGVKGKAKEAVGTVAGRNDLVREGQAQQ